MNDFCPQHDEFKKLVTETHTMTTEIYQALRGDLEKPGWLTRIEKNESNLKVINRFGLWLGGIIGVGVLTFIGAVVTHSIEITTTK